MGNLVGIEYEAPGYEGDPEDLLVRRQEHLPFDMRELGAYPVAKTLHPGISIQQDLQEKHFASYNGPLIEGEQ